MTQQNVFTVFKNKFPEIAENSTEWFPNGKSSVRVRLKDKQEFIFSYQSEKVWCLETIDSHIAHMKGEKLI